MIRFWSKVRADGCDECWQWTGAANDRGYGQLRVDGRALYAHRLAWKLSFGPVPRGQWVLHRCDTPRCVNPRHLFLGTHRENMRDMAEKERSPRRKLTSVEVRAIRAAVGSTSQNALAIRYGVTRGAIWRIVHGLNWRHVA